MGSPRTYKLSNRAACLRSISRRCGPCSALILLVRCLRIIPGTRFRLSSGLITRDRVVQASGFGLQASALVSGAAEGVPFAVRLEGTSEFPLIQTGYRKELAY